MSETAQWNAAVDGNFADAANWSTGVAPGVIGSSRVSNGDTALLDATGGNYKVTFNNSTDSNGETYNLAETSIAANATLYVLGSKGKGTGFVTNFAENNGKIVIGQASGGYGASVANYSDASQVNKGLVVVKANGSIFEDASFDNEGVVQTLGGLVDILGSTVENGKWRIDGGAIYWGDNLLDGGNLNSYLGPVTFNGSNGGTFELSEGSSRKMAVISGFSTSGDTSVILYDWTKGADFTVDQTTKGTELILGDKHYIHFSGDYTKATFSVVSEILGELPALVVTANLNTTTAVSRFSQTAASFGATSAASITAADLLHSTARMLLAANTHV